MERLTEAERLPILPKRKEAVSRERLKEMAGDGWRERERREREERELNTPVRLVAFIEGGAVEVFGGSAEGCGLLLCFLLTLTHTLLHSLCGVNLSKFWKPGREPSVVALLPRAQVQGMPWLMGQGEDLICK